MALTSILLAVIRPMYVQATAMAIVTTVKGRATSMNRFIANKEKDSTTLPSVAWLSCPCWYLTISVLKKDYQKR